MLPLKEIRVVQRDGDVGNVDGGGWFILALTENGNLVRGIPKSAPDGKLTMKWDHVGDAED